MNGRRRKIEGQMRCSFLYLTSFKIEICCKVQRSMSPDEIRIDVFQYGPLNSDPVIKQTAKRKCNMKYLVFCDFQYLNSTPPPHVFLIEFGRIMRTIFSNIGGGVTALEEYLPILPIFHLIVQIVFVFNLRPIFIFFHHMCITFTVFIYNLLNTSFAHITRDIPFRF